MKIKDILASLEKEKIKLAERRDRLRELVADVEELEDTANGALDDVEVAIDKLSNLV